MALQTWALTNLALLDGGTGEPAKCAQAESEDPNRRKRNCFNLYLNGAIIFDYLLLIETPIILESYNCFLKSGNSLWPFPHECYFY